MTPELIEGDSFYFVVADCTKFFFIISVITVSFRLYPSTETTEQIREDWALQFVFIIRYAILPHIVVSNRPDLSIETSLVASGPNLKDCLRKLINQSNKQYNFGHIATERIHHFAISVVGDVMSLSLSLLSDVTRRPKRTFVFSAGTSDSQKLVCVCRLEQFS